MNKKQTSLRSRAVDFHAELLQIQREYNNRIFDVDVKLVYISAASTSLLITLLSTVYNGSGNLVGAGKVFWAALFWGASIAFLILGNILKAHTLKIERSLLSLDKLEVDSTNLDPKNEAIISEAIGSKLKTKASLWVKIYEISALILRIGGYVAFMAAYIFVILVIKDITN